MEQVSTVLGAIDDFVWGVPLMVLILAGGIWLSIRVGFLQVRRLPLALRWMVKNEEEGEALDAKSGNANCKDCRIVAEHADNAGRAGYADKGGNAHYHETAFDAEPEGIPDAFVFSGTIIKSADRLEALSDAKGYAEKEVYDPCDNAHGCNSSITVRACKTV